MNNNDPLYFVFWRQAQADRSGPFSHVSFYTSLDQAHKTIPMTMATKSLTPVICGENGTLVYELSHPLRDLANLAQGLKDPLFIKIPRKAYKQSPLLKAFHKACDGQGGYKTFPTHLVGNRKGSTLLKKRGYLNP